jgi:dipeptidyl-peptidase-4
MDKSMVTDYPLVNTTARIAREQPFKYPMAGMKSHEVTVGIYNTANDSILYLDTRRDESIAERENYLTNLAWDPNEEYLYIAKINRDQNHMWLERYDVSDGEFDTVLFEETNARYTEPCDPMIFVPNHPDQFLWFSLRDGYKHLYLYNTDGQLLKQVASGKYEVEEFIGFDAKAENIFIYANRESATGRAAYKVNLKNGQMTLLTPAKGSIPLPFRAHLALSVIPPRAR